MKGGQKYQRYVMGAGRAEPEFGDNIGIRNASRGLAGEKRRIPRR